MSEFTLITKDNEVSDINMVQVEKSDLEVKKEIFSLNYINRELAVIATQIQNLQAKKVEFEALRVAVANEGNKVVLKPEEQLANGDIPITP